MNVADAYRLNYDKIAEDHVRVWRETGRNPFQDPDVVQVNEDATFGNITRYVPPGSFILDAGCGMGDLMQRLRASYDVVGAEIASAYLDVLTERDLDWYRSPIEELPFNDDTFDCVVVADILEHVINLHAAAAEIVRVLRPGGYLVVRAPNRETIDCEWWAGYEFVHLRTLDEGTLCILFSRLLGCEKVEACSNDSVIHLVVRK